MTEERTTRERHQKVAELFRSVCELNPEEQAAYLDRMCPDATLRDEVLQLLDYDDRRAHPGLSGTDEQRGRRIQAALQAAHGPDDTARPSEVGPYALGDKLGEGGMGEVYAAKQQHPIERQVALKLIKKGMDSAQVVARFETERQTLAMMSHPNIAQVFDGGASVDGRPYFVMELVEGIPITEHCSERGLSTHERLSLFLEVCDGVQHAHQKGVIHRDLKPSNVLVTEYDGRAVPKIIDFGVARATTGSLAERTLHTRVGQMVGTLDYMSPEQADPTHADVDTRADVYSLGVLLYELVTGLLPFDHSSAADVPLSEMRRVVCEVDPPTPSTRVRQHASTTAEKPVRATAEHLLIRQLTGDLDWITLKALEKNPDRRYSSAAALADDLRRHLADEPVLAGPPGAAYRATKWIRRHRIGAATAVLIIAAIGVGFYGVVSGRRAAESKSEELMRLSDGQRLEQIERDAQALWPPHPDRIPALLALQERALRFAARKDDHQATLDGRDWDLESNDDKWHHRLLTEVIAGIDRINEQLLGPPAASPVFGWNLARRIDKAEELASRFAPGGDAFLAWEAALPRIIEAYPGIQITTRMGLMPLGPDPSSGLWEFAHLITGSPAQRSAETGHIVMAESNGAVLVLIPAGTFFMGAQSEDPDGPNYYAQLPKQSFDARIEGPVIEVPIDRPFFISKFELTAPQWNRFSASLRERTSPEEAGGPIAAKPPANISSAAHPISNVTMANFGTFLERVGLTFPSEEQWEYAARAGTETPWTTGALEPALEGSANLFDQSVAARNPGLLRIIPGTPVSWSDGYQNASPVGRFLPNDFGLYDIHGNVGEFCYAHRNRYDSPPRPDPIKNRAVSRGGSFHGDAYSARSSCRGNSQTWDFKHWAAGVRAARPLIDP